MANMVQLKSCSASNKKIFFSQAPCGENEKTHHLEGYYNSTMNFNYDTRGYLKDNHVKSQELLRDWEETGTLQCVTEKTLQLHFGKSQFQLQVLTESK